MGVWGDGEAQHTGAGLPGDSAAAVPRHNQDLLLGLLQASSLKLEMGKESIYNEKQNFGTVAQQFRFGFRKKVFENYIFNTCFLIP